MQLSKLRLALDSETTAHANLIASLNADTTSALGNGSNESTPKKAAATTTKENPHDLARKAFLIGQSEERVQALSVIMLHLCTGLQYAQGVANQ